MRLFIAEKPSLARAIAEVLPGPQARSGSSIRCGGGDVVAWCAGHILETAAPDAYSTEFKTWRLDHLPIVPAKWKLAVSNQALLETIASLLKHADRVVHAGDPDREGQLLVEEVLEFLFYRGPVDRLLVNDLSPAAIRKAMGGLQPNRKYRPLYESALARQRADWLFGMNMTRLYTLLGRSGGYDGVLSVGRVQTPLLGLIVARDLAIENFRPVPYFVLTATMQGGIGPSFRATWTPGDGAKMFLDPDGHLLDRPFADAVRVRTEGQTGAVVVRTEEQKTVAPPLPYALSDLQVDAGKKLGLSAAQVLDACQTLYETQRLITYPRSDCTYLPDGHFDEARNIIAAVRMNAPVLEQFADNVDLSVRSKAWNDKKVTAHHAIIPTTTQVRRPLTATESAIYDLVARRYLAQFYGPHQYASTRLEILVAGERFQVTGKRVTAEGWRALADDLNAAPDDPTTPEEEPNSERLSALTEGDSVTASGVTVADKRTTPPKPYTDASLIQAMCNVARYVEHPAVKKILVDTDGIGTPATRAAIIETLFDRGFITRRNKTVVSTMTGRALVKVLPRVATTPEMTAVWERAIRAIAQEDQSADAFLARVGLELQNLVRQGRALGALSIEAKAPSRPRAKPVAAHRQPDKRVPSNRPRSSR